MNNQLNFSSVLGFNNSVKHLQTANIINKYLTANCNFSDIINALSSKIKNQQIPYLTRVFLVEKFEYQFLSFNLSKQVNDFSYLLKKLGTYNQVNTSIIYYDDHLGFNCLNPQSSKDWEALDLNFDTLVTVYAKSSQNLQNLLPGFLNDIKLIFNGATDLEDKKSFIGKTNVVKTLKDVKKAFVVKAAPKVEDTPKTADAPVEKEKPASPTPVKKKMTPKYSIQITNELFHNGNVEAWKNIIESYNVTYPDIELIIYHQGVKIININSLFKWGKVKNGDIILFALIGEKFQSISKLQRYLFEGASNRFARYLKKDINNPLNLFS